MSVQKVENTQISFVGELIPKLKIISLNPGFQTINRFADHENSFETLLI